MLFWYSGMLLALDAVKVIERRMQLMAHGKCTWDELTLMFAEKLDAVADAKAILVGGGDPSLVIDNYRRIVAANAARLDDNVQTRIGGMS
jgi:hypothetical protein